ncbi:myeloid differentiation primary response protein MyD88 isoform X2 [Nematostella vectensis]|uniref:myeloid differentiation primary response protein MyD88 isoform X2 n=1 Tax=Nematostella vectensis TaxID=45351 RepID=UPI0013900E7D|nr:myeloid differentiation primary response protein MyD88 isoform X2 [Nematostella vectensis]
MRKLLGRLSRSFGRTGSRHSSTPRPVTVENNTNNPQVQFIPTTEENNMADRAPEVKATDSVKNIQNNDFTAQNGEPGEKMVKHMCRAAHELLSERLRPLTTSHNWKELADLLGFNYDEILAFETGNDPVEALIRLWEFRDNDATIKRLKSCLKSMEREDILQDLKPFEERSFGLHNNSNLTHLPDDEMYDAFVCYAPEDVEFVKQLLQKMEGPPYNLRLCVDYRDILPGASELHGIAHIIEERCRKIIVILSPNFNRSAMADFQAQIGLSLSPDCKQRRLIPVKIEHCTIPIIYRFITHVDMTRTEVVEFIWGNLARSLGERADIVAL